MGKITVLTAENMTLTTAINQLAIFGTAAADAAAQLVKIKRVEISQSGSTTLGLVRGAFATRTGGTVTATSTTPIEVKPLDGAVSGIAGNVAPVGAAARSGTNASVDTSPTYVNHHYFNFANLNGYLWKPAPDEEIWVPPSTFWCVRFLADPATLTGWTISVTLEED